MWIRSLSSRIVQENGNELAWTYFYDAVTDPLMKDGVWHYPMCLLGESGINKIIRYWTGRGEAEQENKKVALMQSVIAQFKPDIIQDMQEPYLFQYSDKAREDALKCHDAGAIFRDLCNIYNDILA